LFTSNREMLILEITVLICNESDFTYIMENLKRMN
jgi:hypothetical protein